MAQLKDGCNTACERHSTCVRRFGGQYFFGLESLPMWEGLRQCHLLHPAFGRTGKVGRVVPGCMLLTNALWAV